MSDILRGEEGGIRSLREGEGGGEEEQVAGSRWSGLRNSRRSEKP